MGVEIAASLLAGLAIGWLTKIPFVWTWYYELTVYRQKKVELYNWLIIEMNKLPKEEQYKYTITIEYFKETP